eukprot:GAHX01002727.1.p1 GENE.GAHX01002727.1~~GAHX01002727.1.p1  ORF type:complete len:680 (+),score=107.36 GAHX01002727.1:232-2271(+)
MTSTIFTTALLVYSVLGMDTVNKLRRPTHANYICTGEHPGTNNIYSEEELKRSPRIQTSYEMSLKTFEKGKIIDNPISNFEMRSAITNNYNLDITEDKAYHDIIQYEILKYNINVNINKEFSNQEKLLKKGKIKPNRDMTNRFIRNLINRIKFDEEEEVITLEDNGEHIVIDEGIAKFIKEKITDKTIKEIISSFIIHSDNPKERKELIKRINHTISEQFCEFSKIVINYAKNIQEEMHLIRNLSRKNYIFGFEAELRKLQTLSKRNISDYLLYLKDMYDSTQFILIGMDDSGISDIKDHLCSLVEDVINNISTTNRSDNSTKNDTSSAVNNDEVLKRLFEYIDSKKRESLKIIKNYMSVHFYRKWKKLKHQKIDFFSMENFDRNHQTKKPIFYLTLSSDRVIRNINTEEEHKADPKSYSTSYFGKLKVGFKLHMFTVDGLNFFIPQYQSHNLVSEYYPCYFTGYTYKEDQGTQEKTTTKKEDYHLVSNSFYYDSLFPFYPVLNADIMPDPILKYYFWHKDDIFGSKVINSQPVKSHLLIAKNTKKFQHLNDKLWHKRNMLDTSKFDKKLPSLLSSKTGWVSDNGVYFKSGILLCELYKGRVFVHESEPELEMDSNELFVKDISGYKITREKLKEKQKQKEFEHLLTFLRIEEKSVVPKSCREVEEAIEKKKRKYRMIK